MSVGQKFRNMFATEWEWMLGLAGLCVVLMLVWHWQGVVYTLLLWAAIFICHLVDNRVVRVVVCVIATFIAIIVFGVANGGL